MRSGTAIAEIRAMRRNVIHRPTSLSPRTVPIQSASTSSAPKRTMTVEEAARLLGISRSTAYECVRDGSLPSLRLRRRIVIPAAAVDKLLGT